jgi:uncharacterized protein YkwD
MRVFLALPIALALSACDVPVTSVPEIDAAPTLTTATDIAAAPTVNAVAVSSSQDAGLTTLINAFRAANGKGPVVAVPSLTAAAQGHAQDMVANAFFSHDSLNGASVGDRARANGCSWTGVSENIAQGQTSPEQAMQSWIDSPGHRRNLLGPYGQIGPARVGNTWVLVLASGC